MNNILFKVLLLKGENGNSIASIEKTSTSGLKDTYTITLTDGSTTTFEVENGKGISSIAKTATSGLIDTYTITYTDNTTSTFTVTNGADGADGKGIVSIAKTGTSGLVDTYTITYTDNTTSTFTVTNGQDGTGDLTTDTETGNPITLTTDSFQSAISTEITYEPIQASGTPTRSNPLPISGVDELKLWGSGKNLIGFTNRKIINSADASPSSPRDFSKPAVYVGITLDNYFDNTKISNYTITTGSVTVTSAVNWGLGFTLPVKPNTAYRKSTTEIAGGIGVSFFDKTGNYISFTYNNAFTTPSNCYYILLVVYADASLTANEANVQLELGSTATTYEPYNPATEVNINLGQTIYGGIWDVERGKLTVDRVLSTQIVPASSGSGIEGHTFNNAFPYPVKSEGYGNNNPNYKCNVTTYAYDGSDTYNHWYASGGTTAILFLEAQPSDLTVQFMAELITPIEIDLTPRIVNLLQGANVVTSNGETIEITYRNGNIATLGDVGQINKTINKLGDITEEQGKEIGKAVKQTSGELDAKVNANSTAMANLANVMLRDIYITTTPPTIGGQSPYPDGTICITIV